MALGTPVTNPPIGTGGRRGSPSGAVNRQPYAGGWGGEAARNNTNPNGVNDPYLASLQAQLNGVYGTGTLANAGYNSDISFALGGMNQGLNNLNQDYGTQSQLLANAQNRDINLPQQQLAQQGQYLAALYGNSQGQYGANTGFNQRGYQNQIDQLTAQQGFDIRGYNQQNDYLNQLLGYNKDTYATATDRNQLNYMSSMRNARSDAVSRGATGSRGFVSQYGELNSALDLNNRDAGTNRDRERSSIDNGLGQNQLNYDKNMAGYTAGVNDAGLNRDKTQSGLDFGADRDTINYQNDQAQLGQRNQMLQSLADDYGVKQADLEAKLQQGADRLNLNYAQTVSDITKASQSTNAQTRAAAQQLITQMIQYGMGNGA